MSLKKEQTDSIKSTITFKQQLLFAIGGCGIFMLFNLVNIFFANFYIPPKHVGLPNFIPHENILFFINTIGILIFLGRVFDAVTDPFIGNKSDTYQGKSGKRIPFMRIGIIAPLFCFMIFYPIVQKSTYINFIWVGILQLIFYFFLTLYSIPFLALIPELSKSTKDRLNLSTSLAIGISLSTAFVGLSTVIWSAFEKQGDSALIARQKAFAIICILAFIFMVIAVLFIKEQKVQTSQNKLNHKHSFLNSAKVCLSNYYQRIYLLSFGLFYISIGTLIILGPYCITVLLSLEDKYYGMLIPCMSITSLILYPMVKKLCLHYGTKKIYVLGLLGFALVFIYTLFLDNFNNPIIHGALFFVFSGLFLAFITVTSTALCADIAMHASIVKKEHNIGVCYALQKRTNKFGITIAGALFASFALLGKDRGDTLGLKIAAATSCLLLILSATLFQKFYNEKKLMNELKTKEKKIVLGPR
jgi:GPH family glycoside/pentoside/hexuronide:cation symporter